ncbi:MAG TPA: phage tail tube protein [Sphingobium sp.]|uniref:phage tail tube protein n=1 Tax=Sphingobium sp. TaxID=1912891 RepID=UPI002ED26D21
MADENRLAGTMSVTIGGTNYSIMGEGTYRPDGSNRESLKGPDGYHGYREIYMEGKMSWKGRDSGNVSIQSLNDINNETIVFSLANGKTIVGRGMTRIGDPAAVNTDDASFDIEFEGPSVSEV